MVKQNKNAVNAKRKKVASKKPVVSPIKVSKSPTPLSTMPAKGSVNKTKNSKFNSFMYFVKHHKLLLFVLIVLVGLVVWWLSLQVIIARERNQLKQAEASLRQFTNELNSSFGYDIGLKENKSCGYRSTVYIDLLDNNPSCGISYSGVIPVNSALQATEYANKVGEILNNNYTIKFKNEGKFVEGVNANPLDELIYSFAFLNLNCELSIDYFDPKDVTTNLQENHEISLSYGCTNPNSHKAFYSVLD
jgi:hypothetical protein